MANAPGLRPSADRARETLFAWLSADVPDARCLDLFAGSGALGFEALSRGAATATFVELRSGVAAMLEQHIKTLSASAELVRGDARNWLKAAVLQSRHYDIAFIDPPFASLLLAEILPKLTPLMTAEGVVYIEQPLRAAVPSLGPSWTLSRDSHCGQSRLLLFRRIEMPAE